MKKKIEYALVFFFCLAVFELVTAGISWILFNYFGYSSISAFQSSKMLLLEAGICFFTVVFFAKKEGI